MTFGQRLRAARVAKSYTQEQLGQIVGVTDAAVRMWESDRREPDIERIRLLADALGISVGHLMGSVDEVPSPEDYDLPADLEMALRGKRWHQLKPETRRIIASVIRQIDAELEAEDEKEKNGKRRNE